RGGAAQRCGKVRGEAAHRFIRHAKKARSQQRGGAEVREGIGEVPEKRKHVLDFVRVEKSKALVDVGTDAAALERVFEFAVRVTGAEQDGDVRGRHRPPDARALAANDRAF